jgi:immunity protein 8 of polymorphic toxin system
MKAVLRRLHSPDADPLCEFAPDDPESFAIFVQALVGPDGGEGEDSFGFTVCTAAWLATQPPPPKGFEFIRSTLLMRRWDYELLFRALTDLCRNTSGDTWDEIATSLSRYGSWEFEDYRE